MVDVAAKAFIFGCIGVAIEVIFTGLKARLRFGNTHYEGCSYVWMMPAYAGGGLLFDCLRRFTSPTEQGWLIPVYFVLIYLLEAIYGSFLKALLGSIPWHYTGRFQWHGLVNFSYAPLWLIVAAMFNPLARHIQ